LKNKDKNLPSGTQTWQHMARVDSNEDFSLFNSSV